MVYSCGDFQIWALNIIFWILWRISVHVIERKLRSFLDIAEFGERRINITAITRNTVLNTAIILNAHF